MSIDEKVAMATTAATERLAESAFGKLQSEMVTTGSLLDELSQALEPAMIDPEPTVAAEPVDHGDCSQICRWVMRAHDEMESLNGRIRSLVHRVRI